MDRERMDLVMEALRRARYDALICRQPEHVVMLTGYQPMLGNTFCLVSRSGDELQLRLAAPADDADAIPAGAAAHVETFTEETLTHIGDAITAAREPLGKLLRAAGLGAGAVVGYEGADAPIATAYTQVGVPGASTIAMLRDLLPEAELRDAAGLLAELAAIKTTRERETIRRSEAVAAQGFVAARAAIRVGATEADVAAAAQAALLSAGYALSGSRNVTPFTHVMAGERGALAYRAYNLTSSYRLRRGDGVTVQMEVGIDGYWAELTRTFYVGEVSAEWRAAHDACLRARDTALGAIREGVAGKAVDAAARTVMRDAGYGDAFKHGLGHGLGFQAINHAAQPILHPMSESVLRVGMVCNIEPAVYLDGRGGMRLNDNVAVSAGGYDLLSADVPHALGWLVVA